MRPTFGGRRYTPSSGKSEVRPPPPPSRFDTGETDLNTDDLLDLKSNLFNSVPAVKEEEANAGGKAAKKRVSTLPASGRPPSRPTSNSTRRPGPGAVPGADEQSASTRTPSRPSSVSKSKRPDRTESQQPPEESRGSAFVSESEGGRSPSHLKSKPKKRCSTHADEPKEAVAGAGDQAEASPVAHRKPQLKSRASTIGTVPPASEGAQANGQAAAGLRRQLSFVEVTIDEIAEVMESEVPGQDWLQGFWFRVLSAPAAPECRSLGLRTLTNWVAFYNRWQSLGNWKAGQALQVCNAVEMKDLLGIPMTRVMEFVKLFDPAGFARVTMTKSPQDYAKVKIPVPAFLTACILMSTAISKQNKIRFLLGIFDENDNLHLEEDEFISHIQALFTGLAALFGLKGVTPMQRIETFAKYVFARIAAASEASEAEAGSKTPSLSFPRIEEWLRGNVPDAVNLPFVLLLQRFCLGDEEDPDRFEDEDRKFRLSHRAPVDPPMETSTALGASFLNRHEVVLAEAIYNQCISTASWHMSHAQAELAANEPIDAEFWIGKLHRALDDMENARGLGVKITLTTFFKKLCPQASHLHLRMFHNWLKENESLQEIKKEAMLSQERVRKFQDYVDKDILPAKVRQELLQGWEENHGDGTEAMEKEEFIVKSCPDIFRAHCGYDLVDEVLGKMISGHAARLQDMAEQKAQLFAPRRSAELRSCRKIDFVQPQVPLQEWQWWNQVLDLLEVHNEPVIPSHLRRTRLICPDLVEYIHLLVSDGGDAFTREAFLKTMLQVTNQRAPSKCS